MILSVCGRKRLLVALQRIQGVRRVWRDCLDMQGNIIGPMVELGYTRHLKCLEVNPHVGSSPTRAILYKFYKYSCCSILENILMEILKSLLTFKYCFDVIGIED